MRPSLSTDVQRCCCQNRCQAIKVHAVLAEDLEGVVVIKRRVVVRHGGKVARDLDSGRCMPRCNYFRYMSIDDVASFVIS